MEALEEAFDKLIKKLEGWLDSLILILPNLLIAILVTLIGWYLTRFVKKYVRKILSKFTNHQSVIDLGSTVLTTVFILMILFLALTILNLDTVLTTILASAGVVGLAIGLALQDPLMNLFSGIMMSTKSSFQIGDWIETNGYTGSILQINLRSTTIRTPQGEFVLLPNKDIYNNAIKNYSTSGERRVEMACGVSYGDDLSKVKQIAIKAIEDNVDYNKDREVELFFTEFGDSSINFILRFWLRHPTWISYVAARSEAIMAVKSAFDAEDIMIPFPIRTLDFGIRGGEKLNEMLGSQAPPADGSEISGGATG